MLIRAEQMNALQAAERERAMNRLVARARLLYPTRFGDDANLRAFLETMMSEAGQYGIERDDDLLWFLKLSVCYGPGFHRESWANSVLGSSGYGPDKLAFLLAWLRQNGAEL